MEKEVRTRIRGEYHSACDDQYGNKFREAVLKGQSTIQTETVEDARKLRKALYSWRKYKDYRHILFGAVMIIHQGNKLLLINRDCDGSNHVVVSEEQEHNEAKAEI